MVQIHRFKYISINQSYNSTLFYALVLYQLNHPDELLGQGRIFSLIAFPILLSQTGLLVPQVFDSKHLFGINIKGKPGKVK